MEPRHGADAIHVITGGRESRHGAFSGAVVSKQCAMHSLLRARTNDPRVHGIAAIKIRMRQRTLADFGIRCLAQVDEVDEMLSRGYIEDVDVEVQCQGLLCMDDTQLSFKHSLMYDARASAAPAGRDDDKLSGHT